MNKLDNEQKIAVLDLLDKALKAGNNSDAVEVFILGLREL